jgi:hypothetical protein
MGRYGDKLKFELLQDLRKSVIPTKVGIQVFNFDPRCKSRRPTFVILRAVAGSMSLDYGFCPMRAAVTALRESCFKSMNSIQPLIPG